MPKTYAILEHELRSVCEARDQLLLTPVQKRSQEHKDRLRELISAAKRIRRELSIHPDAPKQLRLF